MSCITIEKIEKSFSGNKILTNVGFSVDHGTLTAILGPSGSGKSTLLRIISGLEQADSGTVLLNNQDVTHVEPQHRKIGFVFQNYALFKHMTVADNIAFGLRIQKKSKSAIHSRVNELLYLMNLSGMNDRYPHQLSGGQRQRVALARALAPEPEIVLLDEPFGALDAKVRDNLANWLRELHQKINLTSILVTHDQQEAIKIADKIVVINRGMVEQIGQAVEVYENPKTKFVASFIGESTVLFGDIRQGNFYFMENQILPDVSQYTELTGNAVCIVRPEDVAVSLNSESAPCFKGKIHLIKFCGGMIELHILLEDKLLKVHINKKNFLQLDLKTNMECCLEFKKMHFYPGDEGLEVITEKLRQLGYLE
jgi:sulfate transport system ATP-binding protein